MGNLLDRIFWNTLTGSHSRYATGAAGARRYAPGFSPIVAFADDDRPDFEGLAPYCTPGERLYCSGWSGAAPADWNIDAETTMFLMVWNGARTGIDDAFPEAVPLGPEHVAQAQELAALTRPGPFGPRTVELGEYFGCFDGERLIAMAGERLHAGNYREISGVCTHPEFQGRGLARRLISHLLLRQTQRGEAPFLHVTRNNTTAHRFYERLGFQDYRESVVRILSPRGSKPAD